MARVSLFIFMNQHTKGYSEGKGFKVYAFNSTASRSTGVPMDVPTQRSTNLWQTVRISGHLSI
jgi:hypothetical protein